MIFYAFHFSDSLPIYMEDLARCCCLVSPKRQEKRNYYHNEKGLTHTQQSRAERKAKKGENERNEEEKDTHTQKSMLLPLLLLRLQCAKLHTNAKK